MKRRGILAIGQIVLLGLLGGAGCGTEDSDPPLFPEARFEVIPQGGETIFEVVSLVAGPLKHGFSEGTTFTSTATVNFLVENGSPAYSGTFRRVGGAEIRVCLSVGEQVFVSCANSDPLGATVTVRSGSGDATVEPQTPNPEVRFDVCTPDPGERDCDVAGAVGRFLDFSGTIGDLKLTHLIRRTTNESSLLKTPAIVFLDGAEDEANGVFRAASDQLLKVDLVVNGRVENRSVDTGDVIVRDDL